MLGVFLTLDIPDLLITSIVTLQCNLHTLEKQNNKGPGSSSERIAIFCDAKHSSNYPGKHARRTGDTGRYNGTPLYGHSLNTDTRVLRTVLFSCLSRRKARICFLKLTRLIRTPVNADNEHFFASRVTNIIHRQARFTDTGYCTPSFHCHNYGLIEEIVPCSNN